MTVLDVVGGVYGERCAFPDWNQVYGSAGRAAAALSAVVSTVRLHTLLAPVIAPNARATIEQYGIEIYARDSEQAIGFDYLHCLDDPVISPSPSAIKRLAALEVDADLVVSFGMMECDVKTRSKKCVYDPQSPLRPAGFRAGGSQADHLAFIANATEASALTGLPVQQAGQKLLELERAEIVIIKNGIRGATVFRPGHEPHHVPAYQTERVFTIGSGDVFVAAFALAWMVEEIDPREAADYASRAVAKYVETSALPMSSIAEVRSEQRNPANLKGGRVYLAGPFRETGQRYLIDDARTRLQALGIEVFSPVHDIGHGPAEKVVRLDLEALEASDAVFAILNGSTPGTLFEVGYARAKGASVYCVAQNMREADLKLPRGSGCAIYFDYVTALHQIAWRS
ncbi:MAG: PfkB family carbohydrate kinase [Pseudomonadota bacterium]